MDNGGSPEIPRPEGSGLSADKVVMMPEHEQMVQKLQETRILGMTPQSDKFFTRFIDSVAGSEKVGAGLNLAWELAMYDTLGDYPAVVRAAVDINFDSVVDAVTPDLEVATQAKEVRREIFKELRRQQENK